MAAYGLYTHIASNKFRSVLLLAGLFLLIYIVVYAGALIAEVVLNSDGSVDYYLMAAARDLVTAFPYATGAAVLWIVIAYFFHQSIVDAVTGGEDVTRQQQPRLYNLLENLCISRGIPMPKLKVMESDARNAFATGLNRRQYAVTVTTGLLKALNDQEIEAVLGHELTHIRNGDVQMMVIAVIIAGVVGFFGELFFRMFTNLAWNSTGGSSWSSSSDSSSSSSSSNSDRKGYGGAAIVVEAGPGTHEISFLVRDTGIGIASDQQERIFGEFEQADSSPARRFSGTGLGLAISKRIIERMGGRIGVESARGAGSTFRITVALPDGTMDRAPAVRASPRRPGSGKVLVPT